MDQMSILVVDDDPQIREIIEELVLSFGHACRSAGDGLDALNLIKKENFDIVICDIKMPGMDGLQVMAEVRKMNLDLPFIIITGFGEEYSYDGVVGSGAQDFIKKPFTTSELETKLNRIFEERLLEEKNRGLFERQVSLNEKLSALLDIAADLSSELDFDRLFPLIVSKVTEAMKAERTSFYIIDWEQGEIWTKVAEKVGEIRLALGHGIGGKVAETGETINVADAWDLPYFDRSFDLKHNFRTRSVLCMPITNRSGDRIGVIQVINKAGGARFDEDDETLLKALSGSVAVALENSLLMEELAASFEGSIRSLSATVDARHPLTAGHSQRVTEYALMIGREMNLDEGELEVIKYAALLHDIGKIGIRDNVLLKNGPFTPEDRDEMNTHPTKTLAILKTFHFPKALRQVPMVAVYHHEKVNGQGYPEGLTGDQLPLSSKILAVADVFDALTSQRDYPKYTDNEALGLEPMPLAKAVAVLETEAGTHLDSEVVTAFLKCLPKALILFRGTHFRPEYVDEIIRQYGGEVD